jgi:hypothetical protein
MFGESFIGPGVAIAPMPASADALIQTAVVRHRDSPAEDEAHSRIIELGAAQLVGRS